MHPHSFTFRKLVDGQTSNITIDVVVYLPKKNNATAKKLAEQEMAEWREGHYRLVKDRIQEQRAAYFPRVDFHFVGAN